MDWPTTPDAAGQSPSILELLARPDLARQAMYLVEVAAELKRLGYEPEGFQMPIVVGPLRTTLPLPLQDKHGSLAMVYTNAAPWDATKVGRLREWIKGMREVAGVHSSVPAIVAAQFDCAEVRSMSEVQEFAVLRLLDRTTPEKRPPPGELGPRLAEACVRDLAARGITLDYSPESLAVVDEYLGTLRQGSDEDLTETLKAAGGYVGEVVVRHLGGRWQNVEGSAIEPIASGPVVVELPGDASCNPLGKAWKRFDLGPSESVAFFFRALRDRQDAAEKGTEWPKRLSDDQTKGMSSETPVDRSRLAD